MDAERFRGAPGDLGPLVAAGRAEGWAFVGRLVGEVSAGDFARPGEALFGVYEGAHPGADLWGVCGLVRDPYLERRPEFGRLRHLYVLPGCRGQGVATALVASVAEAARRHYHVLRLRTENPDAARLYERLGFSAVSEPTATHVLSL